MPYGKFKMGERAPKNPGDRKGTMPVKPGGKPATPGKRPTPLTPRTPGTVRPGMGYGVGKKPQPGNGGGPVRPQPLPKPRKPIKRGM
jgi:hypothetical protein